MKLWISDIKVIIYTQKFNKFHILFHLLVCLREELAKNSIQKVSKLFQKEQTSQGSSFLKDLLIKHFRIFSGVHRMCPYSLKNESKSGKEFSPNISAD